MGKLKKGFFIMIENRITPIHMGKTVLWISSDQET